MSNLTLPLISGVDIPVIEIQANIHQPRIIEIAYMGEEEFFSAVQFLCITKNKFEENPQIVAMSNLELLFSVLNNSEKKKEKKNNLMNLLTILFPDYQPLFSVNSILLKPRDNSGKIVLIDNNTFDILQPIFKEMFCVNLLAKDSYNPASKRAQEIANKMMQGRAKVAAQKGEIGTSTLARYISLLSIGISMSLNEILNLTIFQLYDLVERYMLYVKWDLDIKTRLAGGTPKDEDKEGWMKNIH